MKKLLFSSIFSIAFLLFSMNNVSAEEVNSTTLQEDYEDLKITEEGEGVITLSETENSEEGDLEEAINRLMEYHKEKGLEEITKPQNSDGGFSTMGVSYCLSQCSEAFRYGSKTSTSATYNEALSQLQGYYWNSGKVNWTSMAGSSIVRWKGSGTAQSIKIVQKVNIPGVTISWSWPSSFTSSPYTKTFTSAVSRNTNSKAATFSGGGASSWTYLGRATLETTGTIQDSRGNSAHVTTSVTIG